MNYRKNILGFRRQLFYFRDRPQQRALKDPLTYVHAPVTRVNSNRQVLE